MQDNIQEMARSRRELWFLVNLLGVIKGLLEKCIW